MGPVVKFQNVIQFCERDSLDKAIMMLMEESGKHKGYGDKEGTGSEPSSAAGGNRAGQILAKKVTR